MSAILPVPKRLVRSFTFFFGLIALAAFPGVLAADDGCGCLETCRRAYGGLRYAKETLLVLSNCWVVDGNTYCEYVAWS